jgi:hypothetical protein
VPDQCSPHALDLTRPLLCLTFACEPFSSLSLGNSSASALYDLDLLRFIHKHPIDATVTACTNSNSPCSLSKVVATMPQVLIMQASLGDFYILLASHPTNGLRIQCTMPSNPPRRLPCESPTSCMCVCTCLPSIPSRPACSLAFLGPVQVQTLKNLNRTQSPVLLGSGSGSRKSENRTQSLVLGSGKSTPEPD